MLKKQWTSWWVSLKHSDQQWTLPLYETTGDDMAIISQLRNYKGAMDIQKQDKYHTILHQ